jgi:hypothetical protein
MQQMVNKVQTTRILKICFAANLTVKLQNDRLSNRSGILNFNSSIGLLTVEKVQKKIKFSLSTP